MLQPGNKKLGAIHHWSLPAIRTCPGRSDACEEICYACNGFYNMASVQAGLAKNFALSKQPGFTMWMIKELKRLMPPVVRIHCSGDFYSVGYIRKWLEIVRQNRKTVFFVYTRSWRNRRGERSDMISSILTLSRQPNVRLWLSSDAETGAPPSWASARVAYMQVDDTDIPAFPVDLIFRDQTDTEKKIERAINTLVCPNEQGLPGSKSIQCQKCRLCFDKDRMIWRNGSRVTSTVVRGRRLSKPAKRVSRSLTLAASR